MDNYEKLIQKLDDFIRKYYLNKFLQGSLIFFACALTIFLLLSVSEYYLYFSPGLKISLLIIFGSSGILALAFWIIKPLLQMRKLGKRISKEQAAIIIGKYFPEIEDKLLNVLQLKHSDYHSESKELINASVEQKTKEISIIPFSKAINLGKNKKYIPYGLAASLVILAIFLYAPQVFTEASNRWSQPNVTFQPPPPFHFKVKNEKLEVPMNEHFKINIEVEGDKLPQDIFIDTGEGIVKMENVDKNNFSYTFQYIQQSIDFHLFSGKVKSDQLTLSVIEKPSSEGFEMKLNFPKYTGLGNKTLKSYTDIQIPVGTFITWNIKTKYTDEVKFTLGANNPAFLMEHNEKKTNWTYQYQAFQDTNYVIHLSNQKIKHADSFNYRIQVIPDEFPNISLAQFKDSITGQQILLNGQASDDYGLSKIQFTYIIYDDQKNKIKQHHESLSNPTTKIWTFQHYFDIGTIQLEPGHEIEYYVEVWDNDQINGNKKRISQSFHYRMPALTELDSIMQKNSQQINQSLSSSSQQSKSIEEDIDKLQTQLLQERNMGWEQEQNLKSLLEKQTQLKNQIESVQKRFEEQQKQTQQKDYSPEIEKKQEALKEQLDHLVNKELADQLKKLQDLLEQKNNENPFNALQQIQEQNKLFNMDLERIQELMKKLELQMKMEDFGNKLSELAKEERQLENKTEQEGANATALSKEQEDIQDKLKDLLNNEFEDILKDNNQNADPQDLESVKDLGEEAQEEMEKSQDELNKNQLQNAKKSQKKAAESLEKMAKSMMDMAAGMDMKQLDIDIKAVRQLLTNLIRYSFEQEELMEKERYIPITSPLFTTHVQKQNALRANANMIKDSLFALSKRVFELAPTINRETTELTKHINSSIASLESRRVNEARISQRYAMSNANNLALLLNESLENMMQMQMMGMPGSSGEGKPQDSGDGEGGAGDKMKDIITGQQQLGEGMKSVQGEGQQSGEGNEGEGEGTPSSQAEQLARLAQQQSELRRQIRDLSSELNSAGDGGKHAEILKEIQEAMDKNETDIVNKRLNPTLFHRQRDILTRLLEAEKSIRNQEEDDKRSAQVGKDLPRPMPAELEKQLDAQREFFDTYRTKQAPLKPFYKQMTENYLNQIGK